MEAMEKTAFIRTRVNPKLKEDVEELLGQLGVTISEAINMFCRQVVLQGGIPFDVKIPNTPNKATLKAMKEAETGDAKQFDKLEEMFDDLNA